MENIIHLLPESVVNQIAAAQVIQSPSDIIKEMVENSIDAGAQNVKVFVEDGGKTKVQIVDDGKGMSEKDACLAFKSHATSKISDVQDLYALNTMGFRGEALFSIAEVAQIELKTRRKEDELGTFIQVAGGDILSQEPVVCQVGSNFSVENLFFNVPVRRKFLKKSNQAEFLACDQVFKKIALVYHDINFELYNNGVEVHHLPSTSLRQRILDIFGKKLNSDLLPVDVETDIVTISGFVGKPESSKKKGANQYFFVNGRYMSNNYFRSAVLKAYENIIPVGEQVSYFIYLSVDPSSIDVNVDPQKTDIKFDNEQPIWKILYASVNETIGKFSSVPMIDFDVEGKPDIPVMGANTIIPHQPRTLTSSYNPFNSGSGGEKSCKRADNWETLYSGMSGKMDSEDPFDNLEPSEINGIKSTESEPMSSSLPFDDVDVVPSKFNEEEPILRISVDANLSKFQWKGKYIVFPSRDGLVIVDQHRAHVRILFEQYMYNMNFTRRSSQKVLFPEIIKFTSSEEVILNEMEGDISAIGFDINNLGGGSYSVLGVPAGSEGIDADSVLHDLVASAMEKATSLRQEAQAAIALSMARSSAIVYGQVLSDLEIDRILQELYKCKSPALTPDGKIVYAIIDNKSVEKLFD